MWVKICGNTSADDAARALALGADAVGFIFARSPRQLTPDQAAEIIGQLPPGGERIGVFQPGNHHQDAQHVAAHHDAAEILRVVRTAGLTGVQIHSSLNEDLLAHLAGELPPAGAILQVLHWEIGHWDAGAASPTAELNGKLDRIQALSARLARPIRVLIDSKINTASGTVSGGTGVAFDWAAAAEVFTAGRQRGLQVIAAGGLRPVNVAEAIAHLDPWGVDVSSGVEASPGRKDPELVEEFLAQTHGDQMP